MNRKVASMMAALGLALGMGTVALADNFKYHDMNLTVVSVDTKAKTLTATMEDGSTSTAKAEGAALKVLPALKAGDKVTATCKDNAQGEHLSITAIKKAM